MVTQPDIIYIVHTLAQFMHQPTNVYMHTAKRLLRYLVGTSDQVILLASFSAAEITAYCDSNWASWSHTCRPRVLSITWQISYLSEK